jgi:hypothetical protein
MCRLSYLWTQDPIPQTFPFFSVTLMVVFPTVLTTTYLPSSKLLVLIAQTTPSPSLLLLSFSSSHLPVGDTGDTLVNIHEAFLKHSLRKGATMQSMRGLEYVRLWQQLYHSTLNKDDDSVLQSDIKMTDANSEGLS